MAEVSRELIATQVSADFVATRTWSLWPLSGTHGCVCSVVLEKIWQFKLVNLCTWLAALAEFDRVVNLCTTCLAALAESD